MKQIIEIVLILAALATTTVEAAYIKVDAAGNALADSAAEWSCVYDDVNQLLWEVKTDDGGIHDKDNRYRWGGAAESGLAGDNFGEWDTLTDGSNLSTLCSHYDWRVPTDTELSKVVTTGQGSPTINTAFFPNTPTDWGWFWSSTPYPNVTSSAWVLRLDTGSVSGDSRSSSNHVRLVRSGSLDHILHLDQFEGTEGYSVLDAVTATASGNCEGGCNKSVSFSGQLDIAQQEVLHGFVVQLEEFDHIGVISSVALYFDPRYNVKFGESGSIDSVVTGKSIGAYATVSSPFSSSAEQNVHSVMQGLVAGAAQSLTGAYVSIANTGITLDTYFKFKIIAFGEPPPNQAPSASFSVDESSLLIDTNIPIDASASTDPDGTISSYQWSTSDGQSASGITQNISFSTPGTYTITLTVTDNDGATATTSQSVTVTSQPPVAAFSIERLTGSTTDTNSFQLDSNGLMTLQLDGSTSNDPDGSIASWLWDTSGTATGTQSLSGQNAVLTVTAPGTATITLTVTDNHGVTATTSQTITVSELENQAPTASFIAMPLSGSAPLLVALDASSSTDSDGSIASYSWSSSDGQSATSSTASFSFSEVGSYIITLTITDDDGDTGSESQTVTVQENQSPTVTISVSPTSGEVPLVVSFDGTASSDSDGSIASYSWLTSDEQSATGSTTSFTFAAAGSYTVTLTVTDNSGLTSSTTTTVTATEVQPPVAIFTATPIIGQAPLTVTVDGTASTTPNDSIIAYQWSSSDGQSASGSTASFTFGEVGTYTITHTVVDSSAQTATSTQDITVTDALTAVIIATPMTGSAPLSVTLDGSGSSTPNSSIIAYNWSSSDGQEGIGSSASFTYDNAGEYTVTLTVIDSEATTATTTETITVEEEAVLGYNPYRYPILPPSIKYWTQAA